MGKMGEMEKDARSRSSSEGARLIQSDPITEQRKRRAKDRTKSDGYV
jgi:hypothetical protein